MRLVTLLLPLVLLPGCLMFQEQAITAEYDAAADRLTLHIVYLGLHATGDPADAIAKFTKAVENDHVCLLDWPFTYEPEEVARTDHPFARFIAANVTVRRVGFFKDALGRLSGGQIVVIERVREMLRLLNVLLTEKALPDALEKADPETQALNREAARDGHAWLRLRGQALEFVFFASDHDFERLKRSVLEGLFEKPDDLRAVREWLARNPLSLLREGKTVRIVVGNPEGPLRLVTPPEGREPYTPVLEAHARETWGFRLDAAIAPLLVRPPARLPPERVRALVGQLESADPRRADAAAAELGKAEGNVAELEELAAGLSPEGRRRLQGVFDELKHPRRAFARHLPRAERVRLLLAQPAGADVAAALEAEIARLPFPPLLAPADPAAFLREWLDTWVEGVRNARAEAEAERAGDDK